jgi:hypothetical protein
MPLLVGGAVALVLAIALGYWLFSAKGRFEEGSAGLNQVEGRLNRLNNRAVFPSAPNVQTMHRQLEVYEDYLDGLFNAMREGQPRSEPINRDRFRQLLEQTLRRLVQTARLKSIALPADIAFGFQRYAAGNLPAEENLGRLVDQLGAVAALCDILYEAGIGELVSVERTVFEEEAQAAPPPEEEFARRRGRGREEPVAAAKTTDLFRDPDGLFTKERYVLVYRAQDVVNWTVLDRLSKGTPFVVVTKVEITNAARPAVVPPKTEESASAAPRPTSTAGYMAPGTRSAVGREEPEILPRELRVVAGQELPLVRLEVELYRFAEDDPAEKGEENP